MRYASVCSMLPGREAIVTGHQLISHDHVVLDPAYVHITQASLAETARLKA